MFSKKNDFTNTIQYKIGARIDDIDESSYSTISELCEIFEKKNKVQSWDSLSFLNYYYKLKNKIETLFNIKIDSNFDLNNDLTKSQKKTLIAEINKFDVRPIALKRTNKLISFISLFSVVFILGSMLVSTYLITAEDYSGWTYLSGLIGLISTVLLIKLTVKLKIHFAPSNILIYAKSTYVIRHKELSKEIHKQADLINFIQSELFQYYGKTFKIDENIPDN